MWAWGPEGMSLFGAGSAAAAAAASGAAAAAAPAPLFGAAAPAAVAAASTPAFGAATAAPTATAPTFGAAAGAATTAAAATPSFGAAAATPATVSFGGAAAAAAPAAATGTASAPAVSFGAAAPAAAPVAAPAAATTPLFGGATPAGAVPAGGGTPAPAGGAGTAAAIATPAPAPLPTATPAPAAGAAPYDASALWWDPFDRLARALEEAARGVRPAAALEKELARFAPRLADPAAVFRPRDTCARAAVESAGRFAINGKAKAVAPAWRQVALEVADHLELNEVQAYVLLVRCYKNGADGKPKCDPAAPGERARAPTRCESYYYTERRDLLYALYTMLQLAKVVTDGAESTEGDADEVDEDQRLAAAACRACADAVRKAREAGVAAKVAEALRTSLSAPPPARARAAMAGGILSRGTAAGAAGAWANAALREQCQLLEVAYVVGMSGRDHLQPMAADIACHIFGVDTLGGRDGLAAAAAAAAAAEGEARAWVLRREALATCLVMRLMGLDALVARIAGGDAGWSEHVFSAPDAEAARKAVSGTVDSVAAAVLEAAARAGESATPQARSVVCLVWASVLRLSEQLPELVTGAAPAHRLTIEAAVAGGALEWIRAAFAEGGTLSAGAAGTSAAAHDTSMSEAARWMMRGVLAAHLASFALASPAGALMQPWSDVARTAAALASVLDGAVDLCEDLVVNNAEAINQPINELLRQALGPFPEDPRPICRLLRAMCASERCAMDAVAYLDRCPTVALRHLVSDGTLAVAPSGGVTLREPIDAELAPGLTMRMHPGSVGTMLGASGAAGGAAIVSWECPARGVAVLLARLAGVIASIAEARRAGRVPAQEAIESALGMLELLERAAHHSEVVAVQLADCANAHGIADFRSMLAQAIAAACDFPAELFPGALELLTAALRFAKPLAHVAPAAAFAALTAMPALLTTQGPAGGIGAMGGLADVASPASLFALAAFERSHGGRYAATIAFLEASASVMLNGQRRAADVQGSGMPALGWVAFATNVLGAYARWPHERRAVRWRVAAAAARCLRMALRVAPGGTDALTEAATQALHPEGAAGVALAELLSAGSAEIASEHALGDGAGRALESAVLEAMRLWVVLANAAPHGAAVAPPGAAAERAAAAFAQHAVGRAAPLRRAAASALVRLAERAPPRAALACDAVALAADFTDALKGGKATARARTAAYVLEGLLDASSPLAYKLLAPPSAASAAAVVAPPPQMEGAANADAAKAATAARAARRGDNEAHVLPTVWEVACGDSDGTNAELQARMLRVVLLLWLEGSNTAGAALWVARQEGAWAALVHAGRIAQIAAPAMAQASDVEALDVRCALREAAALRILGAESAQRPMGARAEGGVLSCTLRALGAKGIGALLNRYQAREPSRDAALALEVARKAARTVALMLVPNALAAAEGGTAAAGPSIRPDVAAQLVEAARAACKAAGVVAGDRAGARALAEAGAIAASVDAVRLGFDASQIAARWGKQCVAYLDAARTLSLEGVLLRAPRRDARFALAPDEYVYDGEWLESALRTCFVAGSGMHLASATGIAACDADDALADAATSALDAAAAAGHAAAVADARADALGAVRVLIAAASPAVRTETPGGGGGESDAGAWQWAEAPELTTLAVSQATVAGLLCEDAASAPAPLSRALAVESAQVAALLTRALPAEALDEALSAALVRALAVALGPPEAPARALDALAAAAAVALGARQAPLAEARVLAEKLRRRAAIGGGAAAGAVGDAALENDCAESLNADLAASVGAMLSGGGGGALLALGLFRSQAPPKPAQRILSIGRAVAAAASRAIESQDAAATAAWFASSAWSEALSAVAALVVEHAAADDAVLEEAVSFCAAAAGGITACLRLSAVAQRAHLVDCPAAHKQGAAHVAAGRACRLLAAMAPFTGRWALRAPGALQLVAEAAGNFIAEAGAAPLAAAHAAGATVWAVREGKWKEASVVRAAVDKHPPMYAMKALAPEASASAVDLSSAPGEAFDAVACELRVRAVGADGAVAPPPSAGAASAMRLAALWREVSLKADNAVGWACVFLARLAARSAARGAHKDVMGALPPPDVLERVARALSVRCVAAAAKGGLARVTAARALDATVALLVPQARAGSVGSVRARAAREALEAAAKALDGAAETALGAQLRATAAAL